ncbi:hypothetical protein V1264_025130 [Littorina saxatilis]|uniref:Uncharacterized protein n=1 Tax=Littorina saxatilis TaxID=31220 RepID=A0AAN9AM72_9CAEN
MADAVMFHAQAAGLRDSDSFNSAQGHEYAEIPDDTDLSNSDNSLPSFDSSPVSNSSVSDDCLHYIACPSSDSSLPEDYLHPVDATAEDISAESTGTLAPREPSVRGKMMKAAEHCRGDPPYVNTVDM